MSGLIGRLGRRRSRLSLESFQGLRRALPKWAGEKIRLDNLEKLASQRRARRRTTLGHGRRSLPARLAEQFLVLRRTRCNEFFPELRVGEIVNRLHGHDGSLSRITPSRRGQPFEPLPADRIVRQQVSRVPERDRAVPAPRRDVANDVLAAAAERSQDRPHQGGVELR